MKKILLFSLLILSLFLFVFFPADLSLQGRYRPGKEFRHSLSSLDHPLYLYWYHSGEGALTTEMELYLQALQRKGLRVFSRQESPEELNNRGFYPYQIGEESHYSAFVLEYTGGRYTVPLMLDPLMLEERLIAGLTYLQGVKPPVVGILTGDWNFPAKSTSTLMMQSLQAFAEPVLLESLADLPQESSIIIVLGHRDLTLLDIDILQRFREKGGSLLFCISPYESDPDKSDRLLLQQRSPFMQWLVDQGITLEPGLILHGGRALPLSDGSPYPAWISLQSERVFSGLQLLWGSPLTLDSSVQAAYTFETYPGAITGGQLDSLAPMDLYREWDASIPLQTPLTAAVVLKDSQGSLAVFGSRWIFSDLVLQSGSELNLEVLNALILDMSGQEQVFSYSKGWKEGSAPSRPSSLFLLLHLILVPLLLPLTAGILSRKRKTPWPD